MYEYVILFCLVMSPGANTEARCEYIGKKNFATASACYRTGTKVEKALRDNHIATWSEVPAGQRPSFVSDVVCAESSI